MLRVDCGESAFCLDRSAKPEFDAWRWVRYWHPLREVVYFKRHVYAQALEELAPLLYPEGTPRPDLPPVGTAVGEAEGPSSAQPPAQASAQPSAQRVAPARHGAREQAAAARLAGHLRPRRR
jgi:hypothetical protein